MGEGEFEPDWVSPPGDTLAEMLRRTGVALPDFGRWIEYDANRLAALISGEVPITQDLASKLEQAVGVSAAFWIKREAQYRTDLQRLQQLAETRAWLHELPIKDMLRYRWIQARSSVSELASECLAFFGAPDIATWRLTYGNALEAAFRTSPSLHSEMAGVSAWLRRGELEASTLNCAPWDADRFRHALTRIRPLTRQKEPRVFVPELQKICAEAGVGVAVVRAPKGCRASGATRFVSPTRALLLLSFRFLSDDHFWFSFFHEAGHLLLHEKTLILESTDRITDAHELEANRFAAEQLVPPGFRHQLTSVAPTAEDVIKLARRVGVSPGIIVGQLQHLRRIGPHQLNRLKRRYEWVDE